MNNLSNLGYAPTKCAAAINHSGVTLRRGAPVRRDFSGSTPAHICGPLFGGGQMAGRAAFAGVLQSALLSNLLGDQLNQALITEGLVQANLRSITSGDCVKGAYLIPAEVSGEHYLQPCWFPTGIVLAEDKSTIAVGTYLVDDGEGASVEILPSVVGGSIMHVPYLKPLASDDDYLLTLAARGASAEETVTTFLNDGILPIPRNVIITTGGTTGDVAACNVTVTGTDGNGAVISETFAFTANQNGATTGSVAFKTVTSIVFPQQDGTDAEFKVGFGAKLGLHKCFGAKPAILKAAVDDTAEGTLPTLAVDADEVSKNTITFNTTLDSTHVFQAWLVET